MASRKTARPAPAKKTTRPAAKKSVAVKAAPAEMKPIKAVMSKSALAEHLAAHADVEPRAVKRVMAALEQTIAASLSKKGLGGFTLPGLLKVTVQNVPAKKARKGIDPFTKQERMFAAKPASVKVKVRAMKKLKDAAA